MVRDIILPHPSTRFRPRRWRCGTGTTVLHGERQNSAPWRFDYSIKSNLRRRWKCLIPRIGLFYVHQQRCLLKVICIGSGPNPPCVALSSSWIPSLWHWSWVPPGSFQECTAFSRQGRFCVACAASATVPYWLISSHIPFGLRQRWFLSLLTAPRLAVHMQSH